VELQWLCGCVCVCVCSFVCSAGPLMCIVAWIIAKIVVNDPL